MFAHTPQRTQISTNTSTKEFTSIEKKIFNANSIEGQALGP